MTTIQQTLAQWWAGLGDHLQALEYLKGFPPEALAQLQAQLGAGQSERAELASLAEAQADRWYHQARISDLEQHCATLETACEAKDREILQLTQQEFLSAWGQAKPTEGDRNTPTYQGRKLVAEYA